MSKFINKLAILGLMVFSFNAFAQTMESKIERLGDLPSIQVKALRSATKGRLMMVQASIENVQPVPISMTYRFKWLDANGFTVGEEETWTPTQIQAKEVIQITGMATQADAVDFRLVLHAQ